MKKFLFFMLVITLPVHGVFNILTGGKFAIGVLAAGTYSCGQISAKHHKLSNTDIVHVVPPLFFSVLSTSFLKEYNLSFHKRLGKAGIIMSSAYVLGFLQEKYILTPLFDDQKSKNN